MTDSAISPTATYPLPKIMRNNDMANDDKGGDKKDKDFKLIVNKKEQEWPNEFIKGAEIKTLAGSPADWVVNQSFPGGGEDPEIGDAQEVDLKKEAEPNGIKRFTTRKPTSSPGQ
jgi:hypothetical protein